MSMAFLSSFRIGQQTVYPEELHERLKTFALLENVGDAALRNLLSEANWFALPALKAAAAASGDASVINVSSMYGQVAPDRGLYDNPEQQSPFHYGPAKAGLEQLSRHLAAELGPDKIRVNALVPGPFPQSGKMPAGLEERLAARTMLGRIGTPDDIAGPLLFLAAPASRFVTGASLNVDGGWTAW